MLSKIKANNSFRATTRYVVDKEQAKILGGTISGQDSATISREFLMSRDVNPGIERPVYHLMLSYSHSDKATQSLTEEKLFELAVRNFSGLVVSSTQPELLKDENSPQYEKRVNEFMENDLFKYQFFVAQHEDREHQHTHLVASRVNLEDGHTIPTYKDYYRTQLICRKLERDFGLQQLQNSWEVERTKPSRAQVEKTQAGHDVEVQTQLQDTIDRVAGERPGQTFQDFVRGLQAEGVEVRVREEESGKPTGISYSMDGVAMRGSKLGRNYTYAGLQEVYGITEVQQPTKAIEQVRTEDTELLDRLTQEQAQYLANILLTLEAIWNREKSTQPKLKTANFEDYQISVTDDGHPELSKRGRTLLEWDGDSYQTYGLGLDDCKAMERFNQASQKHLDDRLAQQEYEKRQEQEQKNQQRQMASQRSRDRGFEL